MRHKNLMGLIIALGLSSLAGGTDDAVPYPDGYRSWFHVKTQIATEKHPRFTSIGGIHHVYANSVGLKGYQSGTFADGATLVLDVLALVATDDGSQMEGARRWVGVMQKNSEKYKATGGWGFENFAGDSKTDRQVAANGPIERCFTCHNKMQDSDLVFSQLRP